jgi:hypothetical protein
MTFTVTYPLYIITKEDEPAFVKGQLESSVVRCLAVFTDEEGAIAFRDEHYPDWPMGAIPDEAYFARLLTAIKDKVMLVAFDPYHMNKRMATIPLNVLSAQLGTI